jgi:hypothetical protein
MTASWTTTRARTWTWVAAATWTPPWFKKNIVFQKTNLIIGLRISSTPWSAFCNFNCYSESYIDALCFYAAWNMVAFRHFTRVPEQKHKTNLIPIIAFPFNSWTASSASLESSNSTKAYPR